MAYRISTGRPRNVLLAVLLIMGSLVLIGGAVAVVIYKMLNRSGGIDEVTLCPLDGAAGHVILLVDKSDPMSYTQRKDFEVLYTEVLESRVPPGHLLSVFALADDFTATAEPIIQRCNPGNGRGASKWTQNEDLLRRTYVDKYIHPLKAKFPELLTEQPGRASPILEMVQLAAITGFRRTPTKGDKLLIVVSDLIQNTKPGLSMYSGIPKYDAFLQTSYGRKLSANLGGVNVEFHVLLNTMPLQGKELLDFWTEFVRRSGGRFKSWEPIKG